MTCPFLPYDDGRGARKDDERPGVQWGLHINIFKITAKDKGHYAADDERGKMLRLRRLSEYIGIRVRGPGKWPRQPIR
jgi:hypothetical protein